VSTGLTVNLESLVNEVEYLAVLAALVHLVDGESYVLSSYAFGRLRFFTEEEAYDGIEVLKIEYGLNFGAIYFFPGV
jgi:hypothetical protein